MILTIYQLTKLAAKNKQKSDSSKYENAQNSPWGFKRGVAESDFTCKGAGLIYMYHTIIRELSCFSFRKKLFVDSEYILIKLI